MENIGELLKETRESSGVTIKEASEDLKINENFLLNIEEGKIGCFKDIFELKGYISQYAKYLGIDDEKLIDEFNEYLFEYTSKIPVKEIEKLAQDKVKEEMNKISSPYTKRAKHNRNYYIFVYIVIFLMVVLAIVWSISKITDRNHTSTNVTYVAK